MQIVTAIQNHFLTYCTTSIAPLFIVIPVFTPTPPPMGGELQFTSLPGLQYYTTYQLFPSFLPSNLPQHRKFPSFMAAPEYIPRNNFIDAPSLQAAHPKTLLMRKFIYTMSHTTPTVMEPPEPAKPASRTSPCTGFNHPPYCIRRWFAFPVIP